MKNNETPIPFPQEDSYNTQRGMLFLKEYGRNVQNLAAYLLTVEDRTERTRLAHTLINLMKQLNPTVREHNDNAQRIWDHLYVMTDFKLDIDSPFPPPSPDELEQKPKKMFYKVDQPIYKHYGRNLQLLLDKVLAADTREEQLEGVRFIARLMKSFYASLSKDGIDDDTIIEQLQNMFKGKLDVTTADLHEEKPVYYKKDKHHHHHNNNASGGNPNNKKDRHHHNNNNNKNRNFYRKPNTNK